MWDGQAKITVVEKGPVRVALQVERTAHGSHFVQTVRLSAGEAGNRVEFQDNVDLAHRTEQFESRFSACGFQPRRPSTMKKLAWSSAAITIPKSTRFPRTNGLI